MRYPSKGVSRREFVGGMAAATLVSAAPERPQTKRKVYIVPNFHPASCGWLTTFSKERVYCANSYLNHLDRVGADPKYKFVMSEVNNVIAIMNFQPQRIPELKKRLAEKRVEIVNGYFLESAINLSGGEALVRLGVEGLRWYERELGIKPRFSWNIDVCGTHEQMPQIAAGLGLEALIYTRKNPTGKTLFWSLSPDGSRILTLSPGHYSEAGEIFETKQELTASELQGLENFFGKKENITPAGAPILVLAGSGDYALAPVVKQYPSRLLEQWKAAEADREIEFATLSDYVDAILPALHTGQIEIPTNPGGTAYDFDAFWIENPEVKVRFRRAEHALQAAEALVSIASLQTHYEYPYKALHGAWTLLCLNMDRNTLWGSAGGMVFVDEQSWDVNDRFDWIARTTDRLMEEAGKSTLREGEGIGLFNPLNWTRKDPVVLNLPPGKSLEGQHCESLPDGSMLCECTLPSVSIAGYKLSNGGATTSRETALPSVIETKYYSVRVDEKTGALISLRLRSSGREVLGGPANVIVAERPAKPVKGDPGDFMPPRKDRVRLETSSDHPSTVKCWKGELATTIEASGTFFGGGSIKRTMRVYANYPRIDFETELNDIPNYTVVVAEFPLADEVLEVRRGIPYGFSHGAWAKPNPDLHGWVKGIVPAVRWIDYTVSGGMGFTLLDRGLSGRELDDRTPILYLLNAEDSYYGYPNAWLSGRGKHVLQYSIAAREDDWRVARVPQMAWEYNCGPHLTEGLNTAEPQPFLETSDNVIVEAIRRERDHVELRMVECLGVPGEATIKLHLPHTRAVLTDLRGREKRTLQKSAEYRIPVRAQEIVTMHFKVSSSVPETQPITAWDEFVPKGKLAALHAYDPALIGHPPKGS